MNPAVGSAVVLAMRSLSLSICLWAWLLGTPAFAQDTSISAVEPDPVQIEAARRALHAEREHERLQLTDAWMKYEDKVERDSLRLSRWIMVGSFAVFTGAWGVVAGANASDDGPLGVTLAASGAGAVTLGLTTALILVDDDRDAARLTAWSFVAELTMMGAGFVVASALNDDSTSDRALLWGGFAGLGFAQAATFAVLNLAYPRLFVSEHYRDYSAQPEAIRAQRGLDLLLERDRRQRFATYAGFGIGVAQAGVYATCAAFADRSEARTVLGILAGTTLVNAAANLIVQLVTRTASESIVGGFPPPPIEGDAF